MPANYVNLLPIIFVALGAMCTLAMEPFLKDENKHKILPWVATLFLALAAGSFAFASPDTLYGILAMDPMRRLLGWTVIFCTFLGVGGVQTTLWREHYKGGEPYPLLLLASVGALLMTQSIDFVSLFLGMELAAFPVYGLVGLRRKDYNANEATFKYFVTNAVFSVVFLYGLSLIYGATGSSHFSASIIDGRTGLYYAGLVLVMFALLFKAGAAPVHFWVADVYTGAPVAVTGFMAAVVKVGALAALGSVWLGAFVTRVGAAPAWNLAEPVTVGEVPAKLGVLLLVIAIMSIIVGAFSGIAQKSIRRILAFSAVMNAGFITLGLLLPDYTGSGKVQLGPMYFFLITYALGSAGALAGISSLSGKGDSLETLDSLRGRARRKPLEGFAIVVCLASLAGLPPAAGFLAKFTLFADLFSAGWVITGVVGFALSIVAIFYYIRVAAVLFAPASEEERNKPYVYGDMRKFLLRLGITVAALGLIFLGVIPGSFMLLG